MDERAGEQADQATEEAPVAPQQQQRQQQHQHQPRPLPPPILVRDDDDHDNGEDGSATQRRARETCAASSSSFADLLLPPSLVSALAAAGFARPSPVQEAAIPLGRARCDLIVQAKSGTGKTAVFAVVALERAMMHAAAASVSASSSASHPHHHHHQPELTLVLSPTREVALQTAAVLSRVALHLPAPKPQVAAFVGGTPPEDDVRRLRRPLHVAAGTPGRVGALLASGALLPGGGGVGLLVLDEADQLLGQEGLREDVWRVLRRVLPSAAAGVAAAAAAAGGAGQAGAATTAAAATAARKPLRRPQVLAFSATYTPELLRQLAGGGADGGEPARSLAAAAAVASDDAAAAAPSMTTAEPAAAAASLSPLMHRPRRVLLCSDGVAPMGILQRYVDVGAGDDAAAAGLGDGEAEGRRRDAALPPATAAKLRALLRVLGRLPFQQAVVFANKKASAPAVAAALGRAGFPSVHLSGALPQRERAAALEAVRLLRARVVVATDVLARGVDLARVTLVASLDLPPDAATYAHRCGRTGRFGRRGLAVAFVSGPEEASALRAFAASAGVAAPEQLRLSAFDEAAGEGTGEATGGAIDKTADERAAEAAAADAEAAAAAAAARGGSSGGGAAAQAAAEAAALQHGRGAAGRLAARRNRRGCGKREEREDKDEDGASDCGDDDDEEGGAWAKLLEARRRAVERRPGDGDDDDLGDASRPRDQAAGWAGEEDEDEDEDDDPFGLGSSSDEGEGEGGVGGRAAALIAGLSIAPAAAAYYRRRQTLGEKEDDWEVEEEEEEQEQHHLARFVPPPAAAAVPGSATTLPAAVPPARSSAIRPSPDCARCWAAAYTRWLHEHAAWQHDFSQWSAWQRDYAAWWQGQQQQQQV